LTPQEIEELRQKCSEAFQEMLGLEDASLLKDKVSLREGCAGAYLLKKDSQSTVHDPALYYVISGSLAVGVDAGEDDKEEVMLILHQGDFFGALSVLSGEPSFFSIKFRHFSRIGVMTKDDIYKCVPYPSSRLRKPFFKD
jgi:lysophospholipid hydrolase